MIHELRIYAIKSGGEQAYLDRFENETNPLLERHGITPVGFWTPIVGGDLHELWVMVAHPDMAAMERNTASFLADPDWHANQARRDPRIIHRHISNRLLRPASFARFS